MNLNKASLIGRVTRDPEMRALPSGKYVTKFGLATNHNYKDASGQKHEEVAFHNCVAFGKLAEIIAQYVKKGQLLYVTGRIVYRQWESKEGQKMNSTEINVEDMQMGPKAQGSGSGGQEGSSGQNRSQEGGFGHFDDKPIQEEDINPDDIPF